MCAGLASGYSSFLFRVLQVDYLPVGTKADAVDTKFKTKVDDWIGLEKHNPGKYLVILLAADKDYMSQLMDLKLHGFKTVVAYPGANSLSKVVKLQATQSGEIVDWSEVRAAAGGCHLDTEARPVPHRTQPATAAATSAPPVKWEARPSTEDNDWHNLRGGRAAPSGSHSATSAPTFQDPGGDNESAIRLYVERTLKQWQASAEGSSPGATIAFTGFQPRTDGQRKRFNFFVHDVAHALNLYHKKTHVPPGTAINNGFGGYVTVTNKPSQGRYDDEAPPPPAVARVQRNSDLHHVSYSNRADTVEADPITMRSQAKPGCGYVPRHRRNMVAHQELLRVEQQKKLEAEEMTRQSSAGLENTEAELNAVHGELVRERSINSAHLSQPEPEPEVDPQLESASLDEWLAKLKLQQYKGVLADEGYNELQFLYDADPDDIDDLLKMLVEDKGMKRPHAKTFMKAWDKLSKAQ
eukprot:COSAG02_NODE_1969_length_10226_cov_4.961292_3_plen_467_part_00